VQIDILTKRVNELSKQKDSFGEELRNAKKKNMKLKRGKDELETLNK
jgi:hypothetical protein